MTLQRTVPVGDALLSGLLDADGNFIDAPPGVASALRSAVMLPPLVTHSAPLRAMRAVGIAVVDLLTPLPRGGVVHLVGPQAAGVVVTLGEWTRRVWDRHNGCLVFVAWRSGAGALDGVRHYWEAQGNTARVVSVIGDAEDRERVIPAALATAWTIAHHFASRGREVILGVEVSEGYPPILHARGWAEDLGSGAITLALAETLTDGEPAAIPDDFADARVVFDAALAQRNHYPAITPLRSRSRLRETAAVSARHRRVAREAEALLGDGDANDLRTEALWRLFAQPYFVAERYTGVPGTFIPLAQTLTTVEAILGYDT
ncbi:MAG: P-loop NTPase family protein [Thermomicrobiales bacterium]